MKVITGILSCQNRGGRAQAIRETYFSALPSPFFFQGEPGAEPGRRGDTVVLNCPDSYEHLPRKMWWLYYYLLKHEQFNYFLKIDDDCYVYAELLNRFLSQVEKDQPSLTHYMGSRILDRKSVV